MYGGAKKGARWMEAFSTGFTDRRAAVGVTPAAAAPLCQELLYIKGVLAAELKAPTGARRAGMVLQTPAACAKHHFLTNSSLRLSTTQTQWMASSPSIGSARRPLRGFITSTDAALLKQLLPDWFCFHCCRRLLLSGFKTLVVVFLDWAKWILFSVWICVRLSVCCLL